MDAAKHYLGFRVLGLGIVNIGYKQAVSYGLLIVLIWLVPRNVPGCVIANSAPTPKWCVP